MVNGLNESIEITAVDEPGPGGANHVYHLKLEAPETRLPETNRGAWPNEVTLHFQNGPISRPQDYNGLTNEAVLAVVIDRMRGFQNGPFKNDENAAALGHLECAAGFLKLRTQNRVARGVEGKLVP